MDAIVQARLGSTRMANKIFHPISGRPLLEHVIDRLRECQLIGRIIVATTQAMEDDQVERFCESEHIFCFRGSSDNVLDRFLGACDKYNCERFLRVCSDNPFLDPDLMFKQIESFGPQYDYCSYYTKNAEPALMKQVGFFVEAVTKSALIKSAQLGESDPRVQEHVTFYIHSHPNQFNIKIMFMPEYINPDLRFTVDYPEDIEICEKIINSIKRTTSLEIMKYVQATPSILKNIKQQALAFPKVYKAVSKGR